jgi:SAM-dependent methyltransferase
MAYSEAYFTARESWRDWRIEANLLIAGARVSRGTRVLEIGCGGGGLLRLFRERGAAAVGVDTLPVALNLARRRGDYSCPSSLVRIGADHNLPFRDGAFDVIVGQHVLEHLPDVDAALREWKRLLKPHGRLALATPNARYSDPTHFADADHVHVFAPREVCNAIGQAGFEMDGCRTIFPFLSRLRWLRGLGVVGYRVFQRAPYFSSRGRTIILTAIK